MTVTRDSIIAVIGAGAMGSGIAQVAVQAGHRVIILDANDAALQRSQSSIISAFGKLVERGKLNSGDRHDMAGRLSWSASLVDAAPAALVIEAIVENMQAKAELFGQLAMIADPDTILASNTSSLSIAGLADHVDRPERFIGLHFFNPVPAMKLVEVVPGPQTGAAVTDALLTLMKSWGKVAVRVRDVPGFIVNRVARPYYAEGFAAMSEGIAPAAIDHALQLCGGFRMGPLALTDLIGQDVNYAVAESVYDAYERQTRFRPQAAQRALVDAHNLGRKSGAGVYDYQADMPQPEFIAPDEMGVPLTIAADHAGLSTLIAAAQAAGMIFRADDDLPAESLQIGDVVMALGDGRQLASRPGVDVLLDHARDLATAPVWAISASNDAAGVAAAFAASMGKQLILFPDRPGQIVLRTLAQIANAAADAVTEQVASAQDIDAAMQFGANHPEGPFAWARRIGHAELGRMLGNIAEATGDRMYAPSRYFEQC